MWNSFKARCSERWAKAVVSVLILSYIACVLLAWFIKDDLISGENTIWVSFYASWTQDVLFFTLVGVVVVFATAPYNSNNATFDERIIAFYGSNTPIALRDYAKKALTRFGGYSPLAERKITILEYNPEINGFKVEIDMTQTVKNMFDVTYVDHPEVAIKADKFDNPPKPAGMVQWLNINDDSQLKDVDTEIPVGDGESTWRHVINLQIPAHHSAKFDSRFWAWSPSGENFKYSSRRVVERFNMKIQNTLTDMAVLMKRSDDDGGNITLAPGELFVFPPAKNVTPDQVIFEFTLEPATIGA